MALLEVKNLSVNFGGLRALDNVSLFVEEGVIYGLIGPNGAGKSTLFNCLSRIYVPDSGKIYFSGKDLLRFPPDAIVGIGIARTFQNTELFHSMTAFEHLIAGQHSVIRAGILRCALGLNRKWKKMVRERADEVIKFLKLESILDQDVKALPIGHQKIIELGRALVSRPKILLLDEPAAGMNATETIELRDLIWRIRNDLGITVLLVEHDMTLVMEVTDRVMVLDFGQCIAEGKPEEIKVNPKVIEAYLGEELSSADLN